MENYSHLCFHYVENKPRCKFCQTTSELLHALPPPSLWQGFYGQSGCSFQRLTCKHLGAREGKSFA